MAKEAYDVIIKAEIFRQLTKQEEAEGVKRGEAIFEIPMTHRGVDYLQMVAMESILLQVGKALNELAWAEAADKGFDPGQIKKLRKLLDDIQNPPDIAG